MVTTVPMELMCSHIKGQHPIRQERIIIPIQEITTQIAVGQQEAEATMEAVADMAVDMAQAMAAFGLSSPLNCAQLMRCSWVPIDRATPQLPGGSLALNGSKTAEHRYTHRMAAAGCETRGRG